MNKRRNFLFLQGVCSPFFMRLADRLIAEGHGVYKVNFTAGDIAYWSHKPATGFRHNLEALPDFLKKKFQKYGITDQVLFGDQRPIHKPAVTLGKEQGIRTYVFEEGYFRPYWVTLEQGGVNNYSSLPKDPDWYRSVAQKIPNYGDGIAFQSPFFTRAKHDVIYHLASATNPILFPQYKSHVNTPIVEEYLGYIKRTIRLRGAEARERLFIDNLVKDKTAFYFLPLQLNSDAQIREHSPFNDMTEVMTFVMESFAKHAEKSARLVIKNHPLEMGTTDYVKIIEHLQHRFGIANRVDFIETGDLNTLLQYAQGVVTVNSTVGGLALQYGCPTICLSDPIYNIEGLTYQGNLDHFWSEKTPPDFALFKNFRNTVIHTTQVNGGFYCEQGIKLAVENSMHLILPERTPLEKLL